MIIVLWGRYEHQLQRIHINRPAAFKKRVNTFPAAQAFLLMESVFDRIGVCFKRLNTGPGAGCFLFAKDNFLLLQKTKLLLWEKEIKEANGVRSILARQA